MKIAYVVHRYVPYPGGTEYYIHNLAKETIHQGHEAIVVTGAAHDAYVSTIDGVVVSTDPHILMDESIDLIVVHGSGVGMQDLVLRNADKFPAPLLFLIVRPEETTNCFIGMHNADYIGCSTSKDWKFIERAAKKDKAVQINHSIDPGNWVEKDYSDDTYSNYVVSVGGFWQHKGHLELSKAWDSDKTLIMTGYHNDPTWVPDITGKDNQVILYPETHDEVLSLIAHADLLVMNSYDEGFGLVILEAMYNQTPWAARPVGGVPDLEEYGFVYETMDELMEYVNGSNYHKKIAPSGDVFVEENHLTDSTVTQILNVAKGANT